MLIEIHMIQNHAPSNLNRDDTGSPKEAIFGGAMRARISSQCIKRSIRTSEIFKNAFEGKLAARTRLLPDKVKKTLQSSGRSEEVAEAIGKKATEIGSAKPSNDGTTRQLIFFSDEELVIISRRLAELYDELGADAYSKLKLEDLERSVGRQLPRSVDIALFGRMTTSAVFQDIAAAAQVAHAISTGRLEREFDYFTAVDDLVEAADEKGAGMIGDVEFNSATYYKYFSLDWETLVSHLGEENEEAALETAKALVRAAALTTPSGKQNTFAAHNPPDAILVEVKSKKIPTSYANAFVKPVTPSREHDVVEESIKRLTDYAARLKKTYNIDTTASLWLRTTNQQMDGATEAKDLNDLLEKMVVAIASTTR